MTDKDYGSELGADNTGASNDIDEILTNLDEYQLGIDISNKEYYTYYPELARVRESITNLIAQEANKARIDERKRFDDEIDDVLTRHSKNPDLSPLAELRDYNYNAISSLTADKESKE